MSHYTQLPHWASLYRDFVAQTALLKMQERLKPLEEAIIYRLQEIELDATANRLEERIAIQAACDKLQEIKINILGLSPH
jgi:hypothetical protein